MRIQFQKRSHTPVQSPKAFPLGRMFRNIGKLDHAVNY
jgi:hypothetical protein